MGDWDCGKVESRLRNFGKKRHQSDISDINLSPPFNNPKIQVTALRQRYIPSILLLQRIRTVLSSSCVHWVVSPNSNPSPADCFPIQLSPCSKSTKQSSPWYITSLLSSYSLLTYFKARIKKIMRTDEEVGKVAQVTPVLICAYHDSYFSHWSLLTNSQSKSARTLHGRYRNRNL